MSAIVDPQQTDLIVPGYEQYLARAERMLVYAQALSVENDDEYTAAGEMLNDLKALNAEWGEAVGPHVKARHQAWKDAKAVENAVADVVKRAKDIIGATMGDYHRRAEEQRRVAEAMIEAQRRKEAEDSALDIAQGIEADGRPEEAEAVLRAAQTLDHGVKLQSFTPSVRGTQKRTNWRFKIVDESLVPDEFWIIDETKLANYARTFKEKAIVPGVQFFPESMVR